MWFLFKVSSKIREWVALSDDGVIDEYEEMWMKYQKAGETQCACLTLGFLICQLARTSITGYLPQPNGDINPHVAQLNDTVPNTLKLFTVGTVLAVLMVVIYRFMPEWSSIWRVKAWL